MPKIFISYRRSESTEITGRIYDRLAGHFGADQVFYDKRNVPFGMDWPTWLKQEVQSCQVLIAIIGNQWLEVRDKHNKRRIDNEEDWVRVEIESALAREDIPVIPLLVNGAKLPSSEELPESLKKLSRRQAARARTDHPDDFDTDMSRLIREIERHFSSDAAPFIGTLLLEKIKQTPKKFAVGAIAVPVLVGSLFLGSSPFQAWVETFVADSGPVSSAGEGPTPSIKVLSEEATLERLMSNGSNGDFAGTYELSTDYPKPEVSQKTYSELKQQGIEEFGQNEYALAVATFQRIRELAQQQRTQYQGVEGSPELKAAEDALKDPQVLIFMNNAEVRRRHADGDGEPMFTIAAAVPLTNAQGEPLKIGAEMLLGIAQAQDKVVDISGNAPLEGDRLGMPRLNLEVLITNDRNLPEQAGVLAQILAQPERQVLAVVGHYLSSSTCKALEVGYRNDVVVISPLSTATNLRQECGSSSFFRTTSSTEIEAKTLVQHLEQHIFVNLGKEVSKASAAIFYNDKDEFSKDLFELFRLKLGEKGISFDDRIIDLSLDDYNEATALEKANDADVLVVLPDGRNAGRTAFDRAVEIIKKNQGKVVFGSNPLYNSDVTDQLKSNGLDNYTNQLLLASDWHQSCASAELSNEIQNYWLGEVNRVSMLSYEAVQVLAYTINDLDGDVNSDQIREALAALPEGADGMVSHIFQDKTISFDDEKGDRREIDPRLLITIDGDENNPFGVLDPNQCF